MPYKAAKAVAATFCYNIRWALTPIFGKDFLSMCIPPKDPNYAKFLIDPAIVLECTNESNRWRLESEEELKPAVDGYSTEDTPRMAFARSPWVARTPKQRRTKPADLESGYGTDTDESDRYQFSPQVSPMAHTQSMARMLTEFRSAFSAFRLVFSSL